MGHAFAGDAQGKPRESNVIFLTGIPVKKMGCIKSGGWVVHKLQKQWQW